MRLIGNYIQNSYECKSFNRLLLNSKSMLLTQDRAAINTFLYVIPIYYPYNRPSYFNGAIILYMNRTHSLLIQSEISMLQGMEKMKYITG